MSDSNNDLMRFFVGVSKNKTKRIFGRPNKKAGGLTREPYKDIACFIVSLL